jgi:hypothetical protein
VQTTASTMVGVNLVNMALMLVAQMITVLTATEEEVRTSNRAASGMGISRTVTVEVSRSL